MGEITRYIAGAMSGTSADGVDIAIVGVGGHGSNMSAELIVHHHRPYNTELRQEIFAFRNGLVTRDTLARLAELARQISLTYATAVNEALSAAEMDASDIAAVAAHGQTLFHGPPNTIQWFDPSLVAAEVGCAVISDFRRADLAAGGQGAPLVPFADFNLFRHPEKTRVLLNIGGIANITLLPAGGGIERVIAFDTGPGNCILDYLCRKFEPSGPGFDPGGVRASSGMPSVTMCNAVLSAPYFEKAPPKSTDGPAMIALFEATPLSVRPASLQDLLATACLITGTSIQRAILNLNLRPDEVIMSGGGTKNACILKYVNFEMPIPIRSADEVGVSSDAKEAVAFALLGAATLDNVPSNVPSATGAKRAVVLGSITPKP